MNIQRSDALQAALAPIEKTFRDKIVEKYIAAKSAYAAGDFDTVGLRTGVLAETILRWLQETLTQTHIPFGTHITNFEEECIKLQRLPKSSGNESLRLIVPRALSFVYTIRNKRGIGHAGGDVEANAIDAATSIRICDWCICELVRLYHGIPLEDAQALVDAVATREIPSVWAVAGRNRVLDASLDYKSKALLLLYADTDNSVLSEDLRDWIEYQDKSRFGSRILEPLHREKLVEWDRENDAVILSPLGAQRVEKEILKTKKP